MRSSAETVADAIRNRKTTNTANAANTARVVGPGGASTRPDPVADREAGTQAQGRGGTILGNASSVTPTTKKTLLG